LAGDTIKRCIRFGVFWYFTRRNGRIYHISNRIL
jgi:hypothetical protein